ncbi:hypothetical protein [Jannaschia ovalis]|uniref:Uncharacterized protein n=1 Tax=Jannaschia ovalis TaxID=3038773 RepID=A0ABY8LH13_9RHOB|nr:hypothetical protein [Jannaschia sp. GRR-S6-38]WGH79650.1 hypothetical protein P8627_05140 [Jannaschia sp. GRR-S6-38]
MPPVLYATVVAIFALGAGAATVSSLKDDIADLAVPDAPWQPGGLDGRVFATSDVIHETDTVMEDELHFRNGRFQSARCQEYCDFGWSEYRTWQQDDVIHFTATTRCPDAPHTVVWLGTVTGDAIAFKGTWTTRRWYWTRQLNATGAGREASVPVAAG